MTQVPTRWQSRALGSIIAPRSERNRPDLPLLSVVREKGVIHRSSMTDEENHNFVPDDLSNYKVARAGDLVINKMKAWQGSMGLAPTDGIVSPAYYVFELKISNRRYAEVLLRSQPYIALFASASDGVRTAQWDISIDMMKRIPVAFPPAQEQAAIVRFLDHADRRIRRAIGAKQKLIALLNEQKQAVIHRAVTRGLDPNVRLKPSGVDWLGDVPEHWEVSPLRRRWTVTDCKHLTVPFVDDGIPLASIREVQTFELSLAKAKRTVAEWYEVLIDGGRQPCRGDLIYCRNVSVGAAALVDTDEQFAMGQDVCLIRSRDQSQRYLNYFLRSGGMKRQLASLLIGSTFNRINVADIKNLTVVVPPRDDQDTIVGHLDRALRGTDAATEIGRQEIELLREYRIRLIADVVTGQLDVRNAVAQLPDELDQPDAFDEVDLEESGQSDPDELEAVEA